MLKYHPLPPDIESEHYFGTDPSGRDIFARLLYGYRIAICFALVLLVVTYIIGVAVGCMMGYFGGLFDLIVQRKIEILSNVPFLYVIIILAAVLREHRMEMGFWTLVGIYAFFGWMGMTWYMRTITYKEKAREYIWAAKSIGASNTHIIFKHILPNVVSLLVTFIPFSVSGSIVGLTSLDYLGYGLPKGTPSWGELIRLGTEDMDSYWIVLSVVSAMIIVLFLINSVGEAVREAFDPKKISRYE
jgi:microcin C transport system permease protein